MSDICFIFSGSLEEFFWKIIYANMANGSIRLTILNLVSSVAACAPKVVSDRWFNQTSC